MHRKDYIHINGVMTRKNGKKYSLINQGGCANCAFKNKPTGWCDPVICAPSERDDHLSIIFVRRKDLEFLT